MRTSPMTVLLAAAPAVWSAAHAGETFPTHAIARIDDIEIPRAADGATKDKLGDTGFAMGLGAVCAAKGPRRMEATAFFGAFPRDRLPVQLAVSAGGGAAERSGTVVRGGPGSGFHRPRIVDPGEAQRLVEPALRPGSLVSNGFRSFRSRAGEGRNRATRSAPT